MIEVALIAQVSLWLIVIGIFFWSGQASVFHPALIYLGFHGLVFVVRPILVYAFNFDSSWIYMQFKPSDEIFIKTLAVSSLAMVCIVGASLIFGRTRLSFASEAPPVFTPTQRRALWVTTVLLLPLIAYSIYATRNGVQGTHVGGTYVLTNSTGYLNEAQDFLMTLLVIWMVATRFHWLNLLPALLYVGYRTWFGWGRWTILLFFLLTVVSYCWYQRRKWIPFWSVLVAIPVLLLFNLLGHNRDMLKSILTGEDSKVIQFSGGMTSDDKFRMQFDTQDFANFDFLTYVIWTVPAKTEDYSYGAQYVSLFTEPVPRIIWKGKPVGSPVRMIDLGRYGNFLGLTVSLAGDGWMSGGWVGVILTLSIAGTLLGLAHRAFWKNTTPAIGCIIYLVALAMVPQWFRDGSISIAKFLLFSESPVLLWIGITWIMGQRLLPGYTVILPAGATVRVVQREVGEDQQLHS
jgi:hypothetical protein